MALTFLNVYTGERRAVTDLAIALQLVQSRPDWTIVDTAASPYAQGWEILLSQAPMMGTYPNVVYDVARFDADNTLFWVPRLAQQFTLRSLLASSPTTTTHGAGGATLFPPAIATTGNLPAPPDHPYCDPGPCDTPPPPPPPAKPLSQAALMGIAAIALLLLTEKK